MSALFRKSAKFAVQYKKESYTACQYKHIWTAQEKNKDMHKLDRFYEKINV